MSRFVTSVANLVKEECPTDILHNDMNLCRLMVYVQSIEESKLSRISRNLKRVDTMIKTNLGLRRGIRTMMDLVLLRSRVKMVVVLKVVSLLVLLVGRSTLRSA